MTRGARECWKLLDWYRCRFGEVHPSQDKLAAHMKCTVRTVKRYMQELRESGCVKMQRRGRNTASYTVENYSDTPVENLVQKTAQAVEMSGNPVDDVPSNVPTNVPSNVPSLHYKSSSFLVIELEQQQGGATSEDSDYGFLTRNPNPDTLPSDQLEPQDRHGVARTFASERPGHGARRDSATGCSPFRPSATPGRSLAEVPEVQRIPPEMQHRLTRLAVMKRI